MSRLFQSEYSVFSGISGAPLDFDLVTGDAVQDTSVVRHVGGSALQLGTGSGYAAVLFGVDYQDLYVRAYVRVDAAPLASRPLMTMLNASDTPWAALSMDTARRLEIRVNTGLTLIVTSSLVVPVADWEQCLELRVTTSGLVEAWWNDTRWASVPVVFTTTGALRRVRWGPYTGAIGTTWRMTDFAVNSSEGPDNAGRCGRTGGVVTVYPATDAGSEGTVGWPAEGGGSPVAQIDDLATGDADSATYIKEATGAAGAVQVFGLSPSPIEGAVAAAMYGAVVRTASATDTARLARLVLFDAPSNVAFAETFAWPFSIFVQLPRGMVQNYRLDGSQRMLTTGYLDACRVGVQRMDAASPNEELRVTAMWATYDVAIILAPTVQRAAAYPRTLLELELP